MSLSRQLVADREHFCCYRQCRQPQRSIQIFPFVNHLKLKAILNLQSDIFRWPVSGHVFIQRPYPSIQFAQSSTTYGCRVHPFGRTEVKLQLH